MKGAVILPLTYALGLASGYLFSSIHFPLPWMIGPLIAVGLAATLGWPARAPRVTRSMGQIVVAGSIGVSMTPAAAETVLAHLPEMIGAGLYAIVSALAAAALLLRLAKIDLVTACLACVPLGPMESARLAERYGVSAPTVALSQAARTVTLVMIIPPAIFYLNGVSGSDATLAQAERDSLGVGLLLLGSFATGGVAARTGVPNGPFIGALVFSTLAAFLTLPISPMPPALLAVAQVLLGVSLGCMFNRQILRQAWTFVLYAFAANLGLLALCTLGAGVMALMTEMSWSSAVLAMAPGSLTEMALTAKFMHADVQLVTAFHILRIFLVLFAMPFIFLAIRYLLARS
ncbi:AbrB family transcriptional regulator [Pseudochelatococcus sp. B33]